MFSPSTRSLEHRNFGKLNFSMSFNRGTHLIRVVDVDRSLEEVAEIAIRPMPTVSQIATAIGDTADLSGPLRQGAGS
jgi:hypothetical protein